MCLSHIKPQTSRNWLSHHTFCHQSRDAKYLYSLNSQLHISSGLSLLPFHERVMNNRNYKISTDNFLFRNRATKIWDICNRKLGLQKTKADVFARKKSAGWCKTLNAPSVQHWSTELAFQNWIPTNFILNYLKFSKIPLCLEKRQYPQLSREFCRGRHLRTHLLKASSALSLFRSQERLAVPSASHP